MTSFSPQNYFALEGAGGVVVFVGPDMVLFANLYALLAMRDSIVELWLYSARHGE